MTLKKNSLLILGEELALNETTSGHLIVSLGMTANDSELTFAKTVLLNSSFGCDDAVENKKKVLKLHRQFAHPPANRLKKLLMDSGVKNKPILNIIEEVTNACDTCQKLHKAPNRPAVGFPLASEFNETVALDLKQLKHGIYILHLIDHATRYSSGCIIRNKNKETIVDGIMLYWVKWFGAPHKFLWDNGGEFVNDEVVELAEKCNINIKTTAAESPWSNGLCERHNAVITRNIHKVRLDVGCSVELALAWSICATTLLGKCVCF